MIARTGLGLLGSTLVIAAAGVGVGWYVVADGQLSKVPVAVDIDASRRWVTLKKVHPDFATACREQVTAAERA